MKRKNSELCLLLLAAVMLLFFSACSLTGEQGPDDSSKAPESEILEIPDRAQAPEAPSEGWCGEACIQMAALYFGEFFEQSYINQIAEPAHPGLYSNDIPIALGRLGLVISQWSLEEDSDINEFLSWLKSNVGNGYPVICGVKINPTANPEWYADHFVLIKGYDVDSLTYNTTWGYDETKSVVLLSTTNEPGFSIKNDQDIYFGIAVKGFE